MVKLIRTIIIVGLVVILIAGVSTKRKQGSRKTCTEKGIRLHKHPEKFRIKCLNKNFKGFQKALKSVHLKVQNDRKYLLNKCDSSLNEYKRFGIKDLNPTRRSLRRNRKANVLSDSMQWLSAMVFYIQDLRTLKMLPRRSNVAKRLAHVAEHCKELLGLLKTSHFPAYHRHSRTKLSRDYSRNCDYSTIVLRDIDCAIGHIRDVLRRCRISRSRTNSTGKGRKSGVRIRCRGVRTAFYEWKKSRRGRRNGDCMRRRKLGYYEMML